MPSTASALTDGTCLFDVARVLPRQEVGQIL